MPCTGCWCCLAAQIQTMRWYLPTVLRMAQAYPTSRMSKHTPPICSATANQLHTPTSRRGPSYYSTHSCLLSWLCNGETSSLLQKLHILHHRLKTHRLRLWPIKKQIKIKNYPFPILFLNVTLENV